MKRTLKPKDIDDDTKRRLLRSVFDMVQSELKTHERDGDDRRAILHADEWWCRVLYEAVDATQRVNLDSTRPGEYNGTFIGGVELERDDDATRPVLEWKGEL